MDERVRNVEGVFAAVRLGDDQIVRVDADDFCVFRIECVLRVDVGACAAGLLGVGDDMETDGRLTGGFGAVDFDDAAAREAADAHGDVKGHGARRDHWNFDVGLVAQPHDGAFAKFLFNLTERELEVSFFCVGGVFFGCGC